MPSFQSSGVSARSDCIMANDAPLACPARTRNSRLVIGMAGIIVRASPKPRGVQCHSRKLGRSSERSIESFHPRRHFADVEIGFHTLARLLDHTLAPALQR